MIDTRPVMRNFEPRLYQETILDTAVQKNTLVVLPTGMGKTAVAMMLAAQRLKNFPNSKIVILAPTRPLVEQHLNVFKKHLEISEDEMHVFTGLISPEKRLQLWKEKRVIFSTPQGLEHDVISSRVSLEDVSLMVFDEAHRATGEYAYNFIAKIYNKKAKYPRILALTASPGSDLEKITEVCKNLFIEDVELRTTDDPDVKPYIQDIDINWIKVELNADLRRVQKFLLDSYSSKLQEVKKYGYITQISNGKSDLLRMQGALHAQISRGEKNMEILKSVSLVAEAMKVQHAIELVETQGVSALSDYMEKMVKDSATTQVKALQNLMKDMNFKSALILTRRLKQEGVEHPKLPTLVSLVAEEVMKKKDVKIMIFNQYRDSASKIKQELDNIDGVDARIFFGQAHKKAKGLSQKKQREMLDAFSNSEFNVLVATSVAEEGIDVPAVDLVIFYEPIPSGIRTIQRRGRTGRQEKGRVLVLMTKGTRDEAYRWSAHHKEKRMHRILADLRKTFQRGVIAKKQEENLNKYLAPDMEIKITADHREKSSGLIKELVEMGVKIEMEQLDVGDYILSNRVAVEFKTVPDFVDSIIDGRLLTQISDLKHNYQRPIVIIEGDEDIYSQRSIHPNAIRGMLATITASYGIPILQTKHFKETAVLMGMIAKREQEDVTRTFSMHANKKPLSFKEQQEYIVSSLPGVGPLLAKPLLEKFNSVKNIVNASEEELREVEKIGERKARQIKEVLEREYQTTIQVFDRNWCYRNLKNKTDDV